MAASGPEDKAKGEDKGRGARRKTPSRADRAAETKASIVSAALAEFLDRGFAGARLDEISKRAGVAKGTIYIHFKDKEALFEGIVRQMILPAHDAMEAKAKEKPPQSPEELLEEFLLPLLRDLQAERRLDLLRLLISDGPRFPALNEIYFRVVAEPNLLRMREMVASSTKPEVSGLSEFPQLMTSPIISGLIWNLLFGSFEPIDLEAMLRTHVRLLSVWMTGENCAGGAKPPAAPKEE